MCFQLDRFLSFGEHSYIRDLHIRSNWLSIFVDEIFEFYVPEVYILALNEDNYLKIVKQENMRIRDAENNSESVFVFAAPRCDERDTSKCKQLRLFHVQTDMLGKGQRQ